MKNSLRLVWMFCLPILLIGSGCATNRGILDMRVPEHPNPPSGPSVRIVRVTDKRVFEKAARVPSVPSLKGGEIEDQAVTVRTIARKRNGYGMAMGDILLPEGRTVENLVREELAKSFRDAGCRVVDNPQDGDEKVIPVEADIEQFWSWVTHGVLAISMEFQAKVSIKGDVPPFGKGETVQGYLKMHTQAARTRAWMNTLNKGIEAFVGETTKRLTAAGE